MNKDKWIFFDLDGTLVDNLSSLYLAYLDFLSDYGVKGNKKEFEKLNGPSLTEIVNQLKNKYDINETTSRLLKNYTSKILSAYKKSKPRKHSKSVLKTLNEHGYKIALVTSSSKKLAIMLIKKFNWEGFFDMFVFGNEITHSKPHPEIYRLCIKKTKASKKKIIAVEDSTNGFQSATSAGLQCVLIKRKEGLNNLLTIVEKYEK